MVPKLEALYRRGRKKSSVFSHDRYFSTWDTKRHKMPGLFLYLVGGAGTYRYHLMVKSGKNINEALVYVPYYMTYKYSGLSEYGAFWKCIQAGGIYIFTQLVKMLALATFFPTADSVGEEGFDLFGEFLKSSIDLADLVGILLVLNGIPGKGHAKVLTAGVGWAGAEVLLTRFLLLWVGARGAEFDWKYIQKSLESNINLVQHITTATLVWLWSRHDLKRSLVPIVICMLLLTVYRPLVLDCLTSLLLAGAWSTLVVKALTTLIMGIITLHIYAGLAHSIGIF